MSDVILKATYETLYMVIGSTLFAVILGFIPAIILTLTAPDGLKPNKVIYTILDVLVNIFRSFPFVILMVIVIPLTRLIAGKAIVGQQQLQSLLQFQQFLLLLESLKVP